MDKIKKILLASLFLAIAIILGRLVSIRLSIVTISFSFIPIILCSIMLDMKYTVFVATMADIIGSLMFPSGPYFFGFTLTAFFTGIVYSLFLYKKDKDFKVDKEFIIKLVASKLIVSLLLNGILNTIWVYIITKGAAKIIIPVRLGKELITCVIAIVIMLNICKLFEKRINRFYDKNE